MFALVCFLFTRRVTVVVILAEFSLLSSGRHLASVKCFEGRLVHTKGRICAGTEKGRKAFDWFFTSGPQGSDYFKFLQDYSSYR